MIVQGNFTMNAVGGVIHAETWGRDGDAWRLMTDFWEITEMMG